MINVNNVSKIYKVKKNPHNFTKKMGHLINSSYIEKRAIENVSMRINEGDSVGIIGQNGAGKSTLIKMMTGILVPTSGHITVLGNIPYMQRKKNAKNIGIVFGQRSQLWWDIPVYDSLKLYKEIYGVSDFEFKSKLNLYNDILNINNFIMQPARQLSFGQRIASDIACSFLHNPKILFMDEPTIGLDLLVKKQILSLIKSINLNNRTTIILTSHDMRDIEFICKRVIILGNKHILYDKKINELQSILEKKLTIKIQTTDISESLVLLKKYGGENIKIDGDTITCEFSQKEDIVLTHLGNIMQNIHLQNITIQEYTLDKIVGTIYGVLSSKQ